MLLAVTADAVDILGLEEVDAAEACAAGDEIAPEVGLVDDLKPADSGDSVAYPPAACRLILLGAPADTRGDLSNLVQNRNMYGGTLTFESTDGLEAGQP